ncbi:MAG: ABC transporter substrate-binding protein [Nitrospinota bacterium]
MWKRRAHVVVGLALALGLLLVVGGQAPAGAGERKVRIIYSESTTAIVPLVAMQKGFLAAEGLQYEHKAVKSGRMGISSVVQAEMDFGTMANARLVSSAVKKLPLKAVAVNNYGFLAIVVVHPKDRTSKSMRDLVGKRIAIQKGSGTHAVWLRYIDHLGLSERDFKMKYMRTSNIAAALASDSVDAGVPWFPFARSIINKGLGRELLSQDQIAKPIGVKYPFLLYTRARLVQERPEVVQKVVNAWVKSQRWIMKHPEESARIFRTFSSRRGKKLKEEDTRFFMSILRFDQPVWSKAMVDDTMASARIMKKLGKIKRIPDLTPYIDNRFVRKAVGQM